MRAKRASLDLINLLKLAVAREVQVSVQYMLQHTLRGTQDSLVSTESIKTAPGKFVSSHSPVWLPGSSLKKIAIAEMRHAETIGERLVNIGGEYRHYPTSFKIGQSLAEILEIDRNQEEAAIELYKRIIEQAENEQDQITAQMFACILSDEEKHFKTFSDLLSML